MYINREISWLEFNQRVLNQAHRQDLPLLERIKFLSISASNLDEFFQVRVGGLVLLWQTGKFKPDITGLSPGEQLERIRHRADAMVAEQYALLQEELMPLMQASGISPLAMEELTETQHAALEEYFLTQVAPLLTPLSMETEPAPVLPNLNLILAVELQAEDAAGSRFVSVTLPEGMPRRIHSSALDKGDYVMLEDLAASFIHLLFPGEQVLCTTPFRVTRNGDIAVAEEEGGDFAREMESVLVARQFSDCVRLELPATAPKALAKRIAAAVGAGAHATYRVPGFLRLVDFGRMAFEPGNDHLKIEAWTPNWPAAVDPSLSMFENIAQGDILIHNPFESYEPVVKLAEEAAEDPDVIAIKQVLYRTAPDSRFIAALCRAAESGKQVTVLVELKARFDERLNLAQAERLQRSGVQVVYGVKGYKTHAKILLIVRREYGMLRRYCHIGTGNYNENTARIYSDLSLLTCDENLGADASQFFNSVTGQTRLMQFRRIYPSPAMMKARLLDLIAAETRRAAEGHRAEIRAKMNSLNDVEMMDALEAAAEAGVRIRLNIRGICCWAPTSEKARACTRIVSIVDRYLEHARLFSFHNGGNPLVYMASADWMRRNLERRVELLVPIEEPELAARVTDILDACFRDNTQAAEMNPDGSYSPSTNKKKPFAMQAAMQRAARRRTRSREHANLRVLQPHRPRASK
ncbi:MAG: polyphosphate kinase 1 [Akkermansia sp.]|nr:polyphosphate kinase 1 [Akkermansia sp.]